MLLILRGCLIDVYYGLLGPDVSFKLDDNHYLMGWPGFFVQYKPDGSSDVVMFKDADGKEFCPSFINIYAVSDKYIVAKAKEGWFAVNRATLQSWGCYETIDELENKVGEKFGALELVEEFSRSNIFVPPSIWIAMGFISLVFIGFTIGVLFLPAVFKKKKDL